MEKDILKYLIKGSLCITALLALSGCYFRATITPAEEDSPSSVMQKNSTTEFASGALVYTNTPSSYKIRQSVGFNVPKQKQTTPQGYQVYNHVQGVLSSDEVQ